MVLRLGSAFRGSLILVLALNIHHHFEGPPIDYAGLAAASAASWAGLPGPGEPVLIAAGVFAARGQLDLASVLLVAWAGASAGGIAGWLIGIKAGRTLVTAPGPLLRLRNAAVTRGDEVFDRFPVLAILLTPSWIAGIHHVRSTVYLPTNAAGAAAWALGIGLGAYFVGGQVVDFVSDVGIVTAVGLGLLVAAGIITGVVRQRRHQARRRAAAQRALETQDPAAAPARREPPL